MEKPASQPEYPTRPSTRSCSECAAPIIWLYSYTLRKAIAFAQVDPKDVQTIRPHECPVRSVTEQTWKHGHEPVAPETARTWKTAILDRVADRKRARQ